MHLRRDHINLINHLGVLIEKEVQNKKKVILDEKFTQELKENIDFIFYNKELSD